MTVEFKYVYGKYGKSANTYRQIGKFFKSANTASLCVIEMKPMALLQGGRERQRAPLCPRWGCGMGPGSSHPRRWDLVQCHIRSADTHFGTWAWVLASFSFRCLEFVGTNPPPLASRVYVAQFCSAMATTMAIAGAASSQAFLAVSCSKLPGSLRHSAVALPPLRLLSAAARPQRLVCVRATSQVDATSASSSKATIPDTEISITKVRDGTLRAVVMCMLPCSWFDCLILVWDWSLGFGILRREKG